MSFCMYMLYNCCHIVLNVQTAIIKPVNVPKVCGVSKGNTAYKVVNVVGSHGNEFDLVAIETLSVWLFTLLKINFKHFSHFSLL